MFALYDSVLDSLCLVSRKLLGAYPTQSKMVIFDLQLGGWQSFGSFLAHRVVRVVCLCQVLLIIRSRPPELTLLSCKLLLLLYPYPSLLITTSVSCCSQSRP
jgi:hypothetical protein